MLLEGTVPDALGSLTSLGKNNNTNNNNNIPRMRVKVVDFLIILTLGNLLLSNNTLTGIIPTEFGRLTNLGEIMSR